MVQPLLEVGDLIQHAKSQKRRFHVLPLAASGLSAAYCEVQALIGISGFVCGQQDEPKVLSEVGHGGGTVAIQIAFADIGVAVAKDIEPIERSLRTGGKRSKIRR